MNGTKQFNDIKTMYEQIDMMIRNAVNCKKLEEAATTLALGSIAIGLSDSKYSPEERMSDDEKDYLKKYGQGLKELAEAKASQLGCEKKEYTL